MAGLANGCLLSLILKSGCRCFSGCYMQHVGELVF